MSAGGKDLAVPSDAALASDGIRIVVAEDQVIVADGLATMLSFEDDMEVVELVRTGEDLIEAVERHRPDIALVDVSLIGMDGLAAVEELSRRKVATHMMALTMYTDNDTVSRAVSVGCAGYLPKNIRRDELVQAVRAVAAGKGFLHPDVTRPFLTRVGPVARTAEVEPLSRRELQVLQELAKGRSTSRDIARALRLGEETVKSHLSRIYQKLRVSDRTQAVVVAMRLGLIR